MSDYLIKNTQGFSNGYTPIISIADENRMDMNFGILKMKAGEKKELTSSLETACLLMHGEVTFQYDNQTHVAKRDSLFNEEPIALHSAALQKTCVIAHTDCELAIARTDNTEHFETKVFDEKSMLESEHRGKGLLDDTAYRNVRTIFDIRNRPQAKLVLGEVINFPGRWSSYPPHHHPQPELYHYRFTEPQGYGHGEIGDDILKIHHGDTLKILDEKDHAQTAAPGYGMYYIWVIRHLPNQPYMMPEFTKEHSWTKEPKANERVWKKAS